MFVNRIIPKTAYWAHWKAKHFDDWRSVLCPFCPSLRYYERRDEHPETPGRRQRVEVFHLQRSDYQNEAGVGRLCLFCQHLDLGSLFSYLRFGDVCHYGYASIDLGTLAEIEARTQCAFCHIVMCTIRAHTAVYRTNEEPISADRPITISVNNRRWYSFQLLFDKGPEVRIAVTKALKTRSESVPEVGQVVGSSISWKQIRQWIDKCSTRHRGCLPTIAAPSGLRLIDVKDRKVTPELDPRDHHAYVALSYVWGKNTNSRKCVLLKENTTQLEQLNGLQSLSKTIEDAMTICENLGQRFLWVDRLCIVQDDEAKKGCQIHAMADIFQSAVLTIIAVGGDSMESPIPGVSTQRQTFQSQTHIAGVQIASALPRLSRTLAGSVWSTRGWTYQEAVLSSRKLYFTDLEAWFTCNYGFEREGACLGTGGLMDDICGIDIPTTQLSVLGSKLPLDDYWRHLEGYTKRSLTYKSDIYNAFTGILTALFGEEKTIYGLPELYLDSALLWRLNGDVSTWDTRDCTVGEQHLLCPSWAWSSIDGGVKDGVAVCNSHDYVISLVLWSIVDEDGNVRTIDIKFEKLDHFQNEFPLYLAFAWNGGCFEAPLPNDIREKFELHKSSIYQWYEGPLKQRWPTQKEFWDEVRSRGSPETEVPLTTFNHLRPGMLLTRTQTAVLSCDLPRRWPTQKEIRKTVRSEVSPGTLVPFNHLWHGTLLARMQTADLRLGTCRKYKSFEYFEILNQHDHAVGVIEANELCLKSKVKGKQKLETTIHELMAVSLSHEPVGFESLEKGSDIIERMKKNIERKSEIKDLLDGYGHPMFNRPTVRVLLISWNKNTPIARRVSMGWIYLATWVETERTWKTVVLA